MTESSPPEKRERRQKRYTSVEMIEADIDKNQRRIKRLLDKAEECDAEAESLLLIDDEMNAEKVRNLRCDADEYRKRADNAEKIRGQKLKNTLAAFKTSTLPGEHEGTIVLQKV